MKHSVTVVFDSLLHSFITEVTRALKVKNC